jgi:amino acid adenylation domain-containing protein
MGAVNLGTTYFQATGRYRRVTVLLAAGVVLAAVLDLTGLRSHGTIGLAIAVALGAGVVTAGLVRETKRTWPGSFRGTTRTGLFVTACCLPLFLFHRHLVAWFVWAAGCGVAFCLRGLLEATQTGAALAPGTRPRVLHLGYEDPRRPGAGGGSIRTHEVNRRLAEQFEITVVCARYRGCRTRMEDGVRYVHVGLSAGDFPERLAYFAALPWVLARYRSDVVVEDFGAPFSTVAVPWMTSRPVLGSVQWLFATEKSRQYHLPFSWVERLGVRSHRRMVAVSEDLRDELEARNPRAAVTVIENGLDAGAFGDYREQRAHIAYLGRLETAQKGLDLLIESFARVAGSIEQDLLIGGDGPDRDELVALANRLGVGDRVKFVGRIPAEERFAWLAAADLVAMPSRYETFGMVAAEALAVKTPVVAFDIPCLRALVDDQVGARVAAYDVDAFAECLRALATDSVARRRLGRVGPSRVKGLNWDDLARRQGEVYVELLTRDGGEHPPGSGGDDGDGGQCHPSGPEAPPSQPASSSVPPLVGAAQGSPNGWAPAREPRPVPSLEVPLAVPVEPPESRGASSVVTLLETQRATTPASPAVTDGSVGWTYDELHRAAAWVAAALTRRGIGPGDAVGVCLPRSKEAIAAMIGIWRAGAAYVPFDPEYPTSRLATMASRSGAGLLIGTHALPDDVGPSLDRLDATAIRPVDAPTTGSEDRALRIPAPTDTAYVLFTSGSSGHPKAVQISHGALGTLLEWTRSALTAEELAVSVTTVSFTFDPFILEVLAPLIQGGLVRVVPDALAPAVAESGATFLTNTPSVLAELLRAGRLPPTLKTLICGGEILPGSLAADLLRRTSISRLVNAYGPMEATLLVTTHEVTAPADGPVPIGTTVPGATVVLLDGEGREVSTNELGEICIHGPQLADGYRDDPEETEVRFLPWTTADGREVRIYQTGDLGRRGPDGVLEFCGRRDRQLKMRGHRVEPAEVEMALARSPGVTGAVVTSAGTGGNAHLVGYVTTEDNSMSTTTLRSRLETWLPNYLVPTQLVVMDSFPTTPHGKVDVAHLPDPSSCRIARDRAENTQVRTDFGDPEVMARQEIVAAFVARVLDFSGPIGGGDDFLDDLGGSSLSLFRLLTLIEEEFDCDLEIERVVEDTTIAGIAGLIGRDPKGGGVLSVHSDGTKRPVYFIHTYLGAMLRYRCLGSHLAADRPMVGIQVQDFAGPTGPVLDSVDAMAEEAVTTIRGLQPHGPYLLGGHSAGGLVAYETARRLVTGGEEVPLVILIDTPVTRTSWQYLWAEVVLNWPDVRQARGAERLRLWRDLWARRFERFHGPDNPGRVASDRVATTIIRSNRRSNLAVKRHRPGDYRGEIAVVRTRQGRTMARGRSDLGWRRVAGGRVSSIEVPGLHNTLFDEPYVQAVASRIDELLDAADGPVITARGSVERPEP